MHICYDEIRWNLFGSKIITRSYHKITRFDTRKITSWIIFSRGKAKAKENEGESKSVQLSAHIYLRVIVILSQQLAV